MMTIGLILNTISSKYTHIYVFGRFSNFGMPMKSSFTCRRLLTIFALENWDFQLSSNRIAISPRSVKVDSMVSLKFVYDFVFGTSIFPKINMAKCGTLMYSKSLALFESTGRGIKVPGNHREIRMVHEVDLFTLLVYGLHVHGPYYAQKRSRVRSHNRTHGQIEHLTRGSLVPDIEISAVPRQPRYARPHWEAPDARHKDNGKYCVRDQFVGRVHPGTHNPDHTTGRTTEPGTIHVNCCSGFGAGINSM